MPVITATTAPNWCRGDIEERAWIVGAEVAARFADGEEETHGMGRVIFAEDLSQGRGTVGRPATTTFFINVGRCFSYQARQVSQNGERGESAVFGRLGAISRR